LRDNFQPVEHIAYSHLVFQITPAQFAKLLREKPQYFPEPLKQTNSRDNYYSLNAWQGSNLERLGNYRDALIHYHKLAAYAPFDPGPLYDLIRTYRALGEPLQVQRYVEELQRLSNLEDTYKKGLSASGASDFALSFEYLAQVTQQQADYKLALFYQGLMLQMQGRHAESTPYYRQFGELYPAYYQNVFNLAFALMKIGECEEAVNLFERTLELKPDYLEAQTYIQGCKKNELYQ